MLSWEAYREVLCRMADAGLIERNWFRLCDQRKMGMLRKPEFKKPGAFMRRIAILRSQDESECRTPITKTAPLEAAFLFSTFPPDFG